MIQVDNLSKTYNGTTVLQLDTLTIGQGESIGLVGNNGAGKTTLFSLLLDLIQPSGGSIYSKGQLVATSEQWKNYTAAFLDETFLIGYLTAEEYFIFLGSLRGWSKADVEEFILEHQAFFNDEVLNQKKYIRDFSKGNQKKIGIVGAFIGNPELVILDEPFANLDPSTQIRLKELVKKKRATRTMTIIISSHDLQHTYEVSDRIIALEKGRLVQDVLTEKITYQELEGFFSTAN
ncbi:ABC transporter ATP-binding protein [Myroides sp. 1354]|uniref:ABC transporter ATP-binding protein n=1 Tax=unclassified Myroides TaxID=2642485 RepID=UPI0025784EB3|nr:MULTISPECIES: ABC transporter ATP-binding protein [unclassified Myroides]MDM1043576.1 ABC transporter ATP-binding protein [Myroides sp. R163-1]MDM1054374.1 ABC transporter ATP-binding protein [Myroides sp. 1354]MDM1067670.1 ABC transporter ATP-binding protein [Myroides sp. 1372]